MALAARGKKGGQPLSQAWWRTQDHRSLGGAKALLLCLAAARAATLVFVPRTNWSCFPGSSALRAHRLVAAPSRVRGRGGVLAAATEQEQPQAGIREELLELAASADGGKALEERVDAAFSSISPQDMLEFQLMIGQGGEEAAKARVVLASIESALDKRMAAARDTIEGLISTGSGDVNAAIRKSLRAQENPLPMLTVLQLNIEQAQKEGDEEKMRVLLHINTVVNEELEKKVSRVRGLLNKLLRMDDAGVRDNLLRHHLTPVELPAPPDELSDEGGSKLVAALVPPSRLAEGIAQLVRDSDKQLIAVVGEADKVRFDTVDRIRLIAKEARLVIGQVYGEAEMNSFGADLTPAFAALMEHKAKQTPAEQPAATLPPAVPLPPSE